MSQEQLRDLISSGLLALKAGGRMAAAADDEINSAATDPELRSPRGEGFTKEWDARIDRAMREAGANGEGENPILEAHYRVAKQTRDAEPDDRVRDLGIVAAGQLALHYWIAVFGTVAAYAEQAGMDRTARELRQSGDEAKQADEAFTRVAARLMG